MGERTGTDSGVRNADTDRLQRSVQDLHMQLRQRLDPIVQRCFTGAPVLLATRVFWSSGEAQLDAYRAFAKHNTLVFPTLRRHGGVATASLRDGVLACFPSVKAAARAAVEILEAVQDATTRGEVDSTSMAVGAAIHQGAAELELGRLQGPGAEAVGWLQCLVEPGQIVIPEPAAKQQNQWGLRPFRDATLSGGAGAVKLFLLNWQAQRSEADLVPTDVSKIYFMIDTIGQGPVARVHRADVVRHKRTVAVKVLHSDLVGDAQLRSCFAADVQSIRTLDHENAVPILDVSSPDEPRAYYVMEYVGDGITLNELVARTGKLEPRDAAIVVHEVGKALRQAHQKGLLHGNLKPENVFITRHGNIKLSDFGLLRVEALYAQRYGPLLSSPAYRAPELLLGEPVTRASDVYSLGALLYSLLTGHPPYPHIPTLEAYHAVVAGEHQAINRVLPDLPKELVSITKRAMAIEPKERYGSVMSLMTNLEDFFRKRGGVATRHLPTLVAQILGDPHAEMHTRRARRRRVLRWLYLATLAVGIGAALVTVGAQHIDEVRAWVEAQIFSRVEAWLSRP